MIQRPITACPLNLTRAERNHCLTQHIMSAMVKITDDDRRKTKRRGNEKSPMRDRQNRGNKTVTRRIRVQVLFTVTFLLRCFQNDPKREINSQNPKFISLNLLILTTLFRIYSYQNIFQNLDNFYFIFHFLNTIL